MIHHDIDSGVNDGRLATRFPPEPNGYLHIGHALSICINFGIAEEFDAPCYLRFDDTNPAKESDEYVNSIMEDVKWLVLIGAIILHMLLITLNQSMNLP